ncbi:di-trans,poly-cis-decaprenylcistransferase [Candidatus Saccharibacteria bacterium]|nr:di-trans,poly-cis-decaprenylcistransferase [Candidatus Saccharibacteria bacterium]MCB9821330.1 di-trans,poly-cis-decaprenylcistransferase [Candidatus Nomurabacteria bacterium]
MSLQDPRSKIKDLIPKHIGIILDGNRRWAEENGLPTMEGHRKGADNIEFVAEALFDKGVEYVSLFVFSTENWKRTTEEVGYLMKLFVKLFKKDSQRLIDRGYRILFAGRRDGKINKDISEAIEDLEDSSKNGKNGTLVFCFNYGGTTEIVDAVKGIVESGINPEDIDEQTLSENMYQPEVPPIDLLVRTSGEQRISGFQLWRAAYAELLFIDKHWPDFSPADATMIIDEFSARNRRFGG